MRATLAVLLMIAPIAAAWPTSTAPGSYEGIATQGSRDESGDWPWREGLGCTQALAEFVITLHVDERGGKDILVLETPIGIPHMGELGGPPIRLQARAGMPATFYSAQNDGCPEFAVEGESVADEARYHVTVEPCLTPIELSCV